MAHFGPLFFIEYSGIFRVLIEYPAWEYSVVSLPNIRFAFGPNKEFAVS